MNENTLGDRMKRYEAEALPHDSGTGSYVVLRLDGCHFHSWTRRLGLSRPFDDDMIEWMAHTAITLCDEVGTAIMAYTQSDEITVVLKKGEKPDSEPWYGNRVQKLCSVSASIASVAFDEAVAQDMGAGFAKRAYFDSRVMFLPSLEEVCNNLIWRQNDCIKNSISACAQSMYSPKDLLNKGRDEQLAMLLEKGFDWNGLPIHKRYGILVHKHRREGVYNGQTFYRGVFDADHFIPRFTEDRQFLLDAYNFTLDDEEP